MSHESVMYTSKYSPQHILYKHPHSKLFPLDDKPSPTHAKHNGHSYSFVYFTQYKTHLCNLLWYVKQKTLTEVNYYSMFTHPAKS